MAVQAVEAVYTTPRSANILVMPKLRYRQRQRPGEIYPHPRLEELWLTCPVGRHQQRVPCWKE